MEVLLASHVSASFSSSADSRAHEPSGVVTALNPKP